MQNMIRPDTLADTSPSGQKARDAALLRATTELFVQEVAHDRDEIRRYEELATHFLSRVSPEDRAFVAERLAKRVDAPQSVISALAKDRVDIACHVIKHSPTLGPLDLLTVIAATGPDHHRLVAERPNLAPEVEHALRLVGDFQVLGILCGSETDLTSAAETESRRPSRAAPDGAPRFPPRSATPRIKPDRLDIWQFLGLDRAARLRLMADLATRPPVRHHRGASNRLDRAFRTILSAAQIVGYARNGERQALVEAIASGLELDKDIVIASFDDATGEPAAVLLKTLGLDNAQAQKVLLLSTTSVGLNANVFFRLTDVFAGMEPWVAEILVDAWRGDASNAPSSHEPHFSENGIRRRPAANTEKKRDRLPPPAERANGS
jgi:uncharacterized protein (DUF2336 family)